ncbi:MAG: FUSC family protein [Campylobacterota bacterium]|nr:FUSC family protein [Campylobacterota bacterium]
MEKGFIIDKIFLLSDKLKFAIKVSLSIMIAYMVPLSLGWDQAISAASTIMFMTTMGMMGESISKGLKRALGTLIGATVGITLIALFPQDRFIYLIFLSLFATVALYLFRAYRGDGSAFLLFVVILLLVFDNGNVDNIFIFGIDKFFMTIFGIVVYTLVGIFLWPESIKKDDTLNKKGFVWGDIEDIKGSFITFIVFWVATYFWINFNPPGGFMFVYFTTVFSATTVFSPIKPLTLITFLSGTFIFALIMYIFILPNLHYAWQLGVFIFLYSFVSFYFFPPKLSPIFLLGLLFMGISNQMHYNFEAFMLTLTMFYLFFSLLQLFYYIPFSTKPEYLFLKMKKRFFLLNSFLDKEGLFRKITQKYAYIHLPITVEKMQLWASKIDYNYFKKVDKETVMAFIEECELFVSSLRLQSPRSLPKNVPFDGLKERRF